jgi:hypothetical protein
MRKASYTVHPRRVRWAGHETVIVRRGMYVWDFGGEARRKGATRKTETCIEDKK